jgi:hypothetical protein
VPDNVRAKYPLSQPRAKRSRAADIEEGDLFTPKRQRGSGSSITWGSSRPISKRETKAFHRAIAAAFYETGIPFQVIQNLAFRAALTMYRPDMPLPTRQALANGLLEERYVDVHESVLVALKKETHVKVVSDG